MPNKVNVPVHDSLSPSPHGSSKRTLDKDSDGENMIEIDPSRKKPHVESDEAPAMNLEIKNDPESPSPELSKVHPNRDAFTGDDHRRLDSPILANDDERLKTLPFDEAEDLLHREPRIKPMLLKAWKEGSFRVIRQLDILWPVPHPSEGYPDDHLREVQYQDSAIATIRSWDIEYVGNVDELLFQHVSRCLKDEKKYARYTSVVQSSGMGKSRTIDELSKKHLVVPLNLREGYRGFPPGDENVRKWLLNSDTKFEAYTRACAFLCALFEVLLHYLKQIDAEIAASGGVGPGERAVKFRLLMTEGQTFTVRGQRRTKFYEEVLKAANGICVPLLSSMPPPVPNTEGEIAHELESAAENLMMCLDPKFKDKGDKQPSLIISLDEAHSLSTIEDHGDGRWSKFFEFRRALRAIQGFPFFTLFLSTTGKVHQFILPLKEDPSNRVQGGVLSLIPPFCQLGFDQLAKKAQSGLTKLEEVSGLDFMAHLGRPLFAARYVMGRNEVKENIVNFAGQKLLCKLFSTEEIFVKNLTTTEKMACMSVRIPFEFNARTLRSRDMEKKLVEKHMRVCLGVNAEMETMITVAPSEPLLSEASYRIMRSPAFDLPGSLLAELECQDIETGSRGELIAMMLCLEARDAAAVKSEGTVTLVNDFIRELLARPPNVLRSKPTRRFSSNDENESFEETFLDSKIYFNHFVKIYDSEILSRKYLWRLIVRGAAGLCADFQYGVDIVIPFLYRGSVLGPEHVSAIFIQVKNDKNFQGTPHAQLFDKMNPYHLCFFDEYEESSVPIIRMVFALASFTPKVTVLERAPEAESKAKKYTAFDIWCAKSSKATFKPIKEDDTYKKLLLRSRIFPNIYEEGISEGTKAVVRRMYPMAQTDSEHWTSYVEEL